MKKRILVKEFLLLRFSASVRHSTVTKADGTFEIKNLDPDVYKVEISSLGFETLQTTINLNSKTPGKFEIWFSGSEFPFWMRW